MLGVGVWSLTSAYTMLKEKMGQTDNIFCWWNGKKTGKNGKRRHPWSMSQKCIKIRSSVNFDPTLWKISAISPTMLLKKSRVNEKFKQ